MMRCVERGDPIFHPSKYWQQLARKNIEQLRTSGIDNIKRTVAQNYFTWVIGWLHPQFRYLALRTPPSKWPSVLRGLWRADPGSGLTRSRELQLRLFTRMLWTFAERHDALGLLRRIDEPAFGNPFPIDLDGRLISQDLANAALEWESIRDAYPFDLNAPIRVCELGAGYGRNAYFFLKAAPHCRYVVIDIPPALHVAQEYLSRVLPDRKIVPFRCYEDDTPDPAEIENADLAFLLPHQAARLPPASFDLFLNISSLHEMTREQIAAYFGLIDRLTRGWFYSKQWYVSRNPHDDIIVKASEYPVPDRWRTAYMRRARVQTSFFEAMYSVP